MRNYLALKELIEEHDLDAFTIDCYPGYMGKTCIAFSMLADKGIPFACEADVHAAILAWIVQRLSCKPTNHIDTLDVDPVQNLLTGGHCGSCSMQLARPGSATVAPIRLANEGVCVVFPEREGSVTLVNLVGRGGSMYDSSSTYRACVITGTAVEAGLGFPGNPVVIRLDVPVDKFLAAVAKYGLGHQWIVGQGTHYAYTLGLLFRALDIRVCKVL
jgi:L-arabinose isomerase